jgi:hypothetical protein
LIQQKRTSSKLKEKCGEWSEEGIDKMESLVKEIMEDLREDPGNGRVGTTGALRDCLL